MATIATNTLSQLFVTIGAKTDGFEKAMGNVQSKMKKVGSGISKAGGTLTKFVTGPIVGAGAALGALATKTGNYADSILDLNSATGLSTQNIQEWQAVAERAGTKTSVLTDASNQLTKAMSRGDGGSANMKRGLEKLGLTYEELANMTPDERMNKVTEALRGIEDPTQRAIIGQQLLKNSYDDLAPILDMSADKIEKIKQEANESGKVMGGDALNSANKFREGMDQLKQNMTGAARSIATQIMPILNNKFIPMVQEKVIPAITSFAEKIVSIIEVFSNLPGPIQSAILTFIGLLAAAGPVLVIVGQLITAFSAIMPVIGTVGTVIGGVAAGPIAAVVAAVIGLIAVWKNWDKIVDFVKWFAGKIKGFVEPLASKIVDLFSSMKDNTVGIFQDMWTGIKQIINWIIGGVNKMISALNKFKVEVPKWAQKLPGVGESFGFNIDKIPTLETNTNVKGNGGNTNVNIENMSVRNDQDIEKLAKEIAYQKDVKNRRVGP